MIRTTEYTTPLQGTPYHRSIGIIKAIDLDGSHYCVGEISYELFDEQNFQYVVTPYWEQIAYLPKRIFSGLPGFDLDVKREHYYRVNITPTFIQMRTPSESREDLWELLEEVGLDYYDRFEWLLRSDKRCGDDNLIVSRKQENKEYSDAIADIDLNQIKPGDKITLNKLHNITANDPDFARCMYRLLVNGADVHILEEDRQIGVDERKWMLYLLLNLLEYSENYSKVRQEVGIYKAKRAKKYAGRARIQIDLVKLNEISKKFRSGAISEEEALKTLEITRYTFYMRLRELKL